MSDKKSSKVLAKAQGEQLKAAVLGLPGLLVDDPGQAIEAARAVIGICMDVNPVRLTQLGLATTHAARLAHADMTPVELLGAYGVDKAPKDKKDQAAANLAELTDKAPAVNLRSPKQHKLSAAGRRPAAAPKPEDPKVGERKALVARARFAPDGKLTVKDGTEAQGKALDEAEKRFIATGPVYSTNGYLSGVTVAGTAKGDSQYVYVIDGCGWLLYKDGTGDKDHAWVMHLLVRDPEGALRIEVIEEPACGKSSYSALEAVSGGYDASQDKRRPEGRTPKAEASPEVKVEESATDPAPVAEERELAAAAS